MLLKKFRKVIAQILLMTFILPNINVNAIVNERNHGEIQESVNITNDINENKISEKEVQAEDTDIINNYEVENNISEDKPVAEEKTEENTTEKVEEKIEENIIENSIEKVEENSAEVKSEKEDIKSEEKQSVVEGEKYSVKPVVMPIQRTVDEKADELEFKLKMEGASTLSLLETKTESPFEIALAYSDGSYSYVKAAESLESAKEEIETIAVPYSDEEIIPVVVARNGQVVYATNAMARIWKHVGGKPYAGSNINTNVYSDSSLRNAVTYVNHSYVDDAPIIADSGNSAQVLISGYQGWINKNTSASEYDMVVVPINQANNPSYYFVEGGEFKHYISSNLTGSGGYSISIGKAPSYLREGVKYLSYDGLYFYDGSNIQNGLNNLMNDYKRGARGNAVNAGNPHYTYYKYLPFRSKTVYSAEELNKFINEKTSASSKLRGIGGALKDAEQKYGVNAILTLGVAINESGWGTSTISQTKNNLFGIKAFDSNVNGASSFATPSDSVHEFAKNYISRGYADPADWRYFGGFLGNKKHGANVKYASDPFWGEKAAQHTFTVDKHLSGSVNSLRDTDVYQVGMTSSPSRVMKANGEFLYSTNKNNVETSFVVSKKGKVTVGGQSTYEIYPERNTNVNLGKYHGSYDWYDKGYVVATNVTFLNKGRDIAVIQPWVDVKAGIDRYETAAILSKGQFDKSDTVVIANGLVLADGLTSTPIATYYNAPLLLVRKNLVPDYTRNEIKRLGAKNAIIVGGATAVSASVEQELRNLGVNSITRLGGVDRYATSLEVAKYIDAKLYDVSNVFIASGLGEADTMSISPVAGRNKMPIILTRKDDISPEIYGWLSNEALDNAYIIGGTTVISNNVLTKINNITAKNVMGNRLGGINRAETNALVINEFYEDTESVYITKELTLVDALAAGPIAALNGHPIVLAGNDLTGPQKEVLGQKTATRIIQAGHGVPSKAINTLKECLERLEY